MISPTHTCAASHNIKHSLERSVMVRSGFGFRSHRHGASPQLVCASACMSNGCGARHARRLRRVRIEFASTHDLDSVFLPIHVRHPSLSRQEYFSMTPQTMRAQELAAELRIHETEEYRVNAPQSIAKPWLSSAPLVGGAPFDFTAAAVAGSETAGKDAALY